ncbi:MAG: hypothetical protein Q7U28_05810 [Aquabacterium sp.]|nr:hypothetical protein [Aquabacterium sp.]
MIPAGGQVRIDRVAMPAALAILEIAISCCGQAAYLCVRVAALKKETHAA